MPGDIWGWGAVFGITLAALVVAAEIGFRLGRHRRKRTAVEAETEARKGHVGMLVAAILALLGLLLAFSFSIVETRFSARKHLVLEEANAIGTTYLRAETLAQPYRGRIESLLREYVNVRLRPLNTPEKLGRAIRRSEQIHGLLWTQAVAVAKQYPQSRMVPLFIQSLNQVIDLHESRVTIGLYQRLPRAILWTLYIVSILALGLLGYGSGLSGSRALLPTTALVVAISVVIVLVVELDRPSAGLFQVSQQALEDVRQTMSQTYQGASAALVAPSGPASSASASPRISFTSRSRK